MAPRIRNVTFGLCLLLALTASTPPGLWTLCLGGNGHSAFERTFSPDLPCTAGELTTSASNSCAPEACSGCKDFNLSAGLALREAQVLDLNWFAIASLSDGWLPSRYPMNHPNARSSLSQSAPANFEHPLETVLIRC